MGGVGGGDPCQGLPKSYATFELNSLRGGERWRKLESAGRVQVRKRGAGKLRRLFFTFFHSAEFSTSEWVIKLNLIPLASVLFFCLTLFVAAAATAFRKIFIKSTWAAEWRIERDEASGAKEKGHWPRAAH